MKTQSYRPRRGFTLVELLVVIAIIAVLAAAGFGMANVAIKKARNMKALAAATAIEQAVNSFYNDYGRLPDPSGSATSDETFDTTDSRGVDLIRILLAKEAANANLQNDKKIVFLNIPEGKNRRGGVVYAQDGSPAAIYDPWGNGYKIVLDYDYSEEVDAPGESMPNNQPETKRNRRVLVYSLGAEKKGGADSVRTW